MRSNCPMSGNWPDQSKGRRFSQERSPARRLDRDRARPTPAATAPCRRPPARPTSAGASGPAGPDSRHGRSCGAAALDGHLSAEGATHPPASNPGQAWGAFRSSPMGAYASTGCFCGRHRCTRPTKASGPKDGRFGPRDGDTVQCCRPAWRRIHRYFSAIRYSSARKSSVGPNQARNLLEWTAVHTKADAAAPPRHAILRREPFHTRTKRRHAALSRPPAAIRTAKRHRSDAAVEDQPPDRLSRE